MLIIMQIHCKGKLSRAGGQGKTEVGEGRTDGEALQSRLIVGCEILGSGDGDNTNNKRFSGSCNWD